MTKKPIEKIILDLCGGTGAWSKPYRDAGYTVHVITLPEYDVTRAQFFEDGSMILFPASDSAEKDGYGLGVRTQDIHGILAAPPCTEFSKAKSTKPRDFEEGMRTVAACMQIISVSVTLVTKGTGKIEQEACASANNGADACVVTKTTIASIPSPVPPVSAEWQFIILSRS